SLYLSRSPYHPHMHPFPTRRSSDLSHAPSSPYLASVRQRRRSEVKVAYLGSPARVDGAALLPPAFRRTGAGRPSRPHRRSAGRRSEEHTSELQSRENLVCRLLLEKK